MTFRSLAAAAAVATVTLATPALAQSWDLLGTRDVLDRMDRDSIGLPGGRQFQSIRLCAHERPVHLIDVDVHFANGGHQNVAVRSRLRPGQCTRNIDLTGADRNITRVDMVYEANTRRRGVGAKIKLFGM
jgi:hypothetical protein